MSGFYLGEQFVYQALWKRPCFIYEDELLAVSLKVVRYKRYDWHREAAVLCAG
jgi:hypothetical protein